MSNPNTFIWNDNGTTVTLNIPKVNGTLVTGATSSTNNDLVSYNGTTGVIQDSGIAASNVALLAASQTFTNSNTFSAGKLNIVDPVDNTKQIQFLDSAATTGAVLTLSNNLTGSQTITFPNTTGTLVSGPTSSTSGDVVSYNGTTGIIQDSGIAAANVVTLAGTQTLTNKSLSNANVFFIDPTTTTKKIGFQTSGATAATTLTIASLQTTSKTVSFPNMAGNDTVATLNVTNNWNGTQNFGGSCVFNSTVQLPDDTSLVFVNINNATKTMGITLDGQSASTKLSLASSNTTSLTVTFPNIAGTLVVGPTSVTSGNLVSYSGTSGAIADSGITYQTTGDQSTTYSGIWATSQACTIRADRIGNIVVVAGTEALAGANTSAQISVAFNLPSVYRPTIANGTGLFTSPIIVDDNGGWVLGTVNISTGGAITITNTTNLAASGNFAGTGNSGPAAWSVTYNIQ